MTQQPTATPSRVRYRSAALACILTAFVVSTTACAPLDRCDTRNRDVGRDSRGVNLKTHLRCLAQYLPLSK